MNKRILILGGTGFLGQALTQVLSKKHQVKAVGRKVNVLSLKSLEKSISTKFDLIINATGQVSQPINDCLQQNSIGLLNLITLQKKYGFKLIQLSSANVYGTAQNVNEVSPLNPENVYATCKAQADILITHFLKPKDYLIIRLSNVYGPKQQKGLIYYLLRSYKNNSKLFFDDNNGNLSRFFLHKNDAVVNIERLITAQAWGIYNLFGKKQYSIKDLVDFLKLEATYAQIKPIGNINSASDQKIKQIIKPVFKYRLKNFLKESCKI